MASFRQGLSETGFIDGQSVMIEHHWADPYDRVPALARPGGNLTGVSLMNTELTAKRLELLLELVPQASAISARESEQIRIPSASSQ
jgi:hypothetical protein